ncbi:peptidyl-prolyl cis-trans isomerase cyp8 [Hypoxylon sp. EC38]|nr:peptidyl-prolyl cis-trans isomerase cyp8 [Hypoxylon sp. EC38]
MGKGTDKLYITHSEWSSSDAYSASTGSRTGPNGASFKRLPFNFCAASLQPFKNPVCTPDGTIFDIEVISKWLENHKTNPVNGKPLAARDLIKLNFARNADVDSKGADGLGSDGKGDLIDPVTFKVLTDNTHIVAIRHGTYANVFAWETVERMNIKPKMWRDLVDDVEFGRSDIITLQDPQNAASRDLSQFQHLKDGGDALLTKEQEEERKEGNVNINALGRVGDKVLRAKEAVEKARREREANGDVNRSSKAVTKTAAGNNVRPSMIQDKKQAYNAATYTTGKAAASFTSTGLTPETSGERATLTDEEYMLKPKRVKIKGYARIETNLGDLNIELQTEYAPKAVWNFTRLAQKGYYKGVTFHRNIKNFMIQGGDPSGTGRGGTSIWGKNFQDEFDGPLTHDARGILSMANKGKNTNSSQFFITYRPVKHLDRKHTIFGKVVGGTDVLSKMEAVPTDGSDRPLNKIFIKDIVVYLDPFEEFLKQKAERDKVAETKAEIERSGGTEDDRITWTGKRVRQDGTVDQGGGGGSVGKYLQAAMKQQSNEDEIIEEDVDTWEEPVKKKPKVGGFGNFDNW